MVEGASDDRKHRKGEVDATNIIVDVLNIATEKDGRQFKEIITESMLSSLIDTCRDILLHQNSMIEIRAPVKICGDIHGQFPDLIRIFHKGGFPPTSNYLFLGDYVDRGRFNLETITLLLAYKARFPRNFFLLRGNHECEFVNKSYGFYEECQTRYGSTKIYEAFQNLFNILPFTALVSERILCMHGGISPELHSFEQLRNLKRPTAAMAGVELDLLWADPIGGLTGFQPNMRGAGVGFGADTVNKLCEKLGLDLIARAHQVVQDGYEFFAGRKLVTIFSAPCYCGQFENSAAFLAVDANLVCSFEILKPSYKKLAVREKQLNPST